jgi:hypothetical protein
MRDGAPATWRREGDGLVFELPSGYPSIDGDVIELRINTR